MNAIVQGHGAQRLAAYATGSDGEPRQVDDATVVIVDLRRHETDASRVVLEEAAAELDTTALTTAAAAGRAAADQSRIEFVTDPAPDLDELEVGRLYAIANNGKSEVFELAAFDVDEGLLWARDQLRHAWAPDSSVVGLALLVEFPGELADVDVLDDAIYGLDWSSDQARPRRWRTLAKVVRRGRAPRASVRDLVRIDAQLVGIAQGRTSLEGHLQQAELELDARLLARQIDPLHFDAGVTGNLAVTYKALELTYRALFKGQGNDSRATWACEQFQFWLEKLRLGVPPGDVVETSPGGDRLRASPRRSAFTRA